MKDRRTYPLARLVALLLAASALSGCADMLGRIANLGEPPKISPVTNPVKQPGYHPVTMPMPQPEAALHQADSLWRPGSRQFFKDQRAARVGDIVTVNVEVADNAQLANSTTRTRGNSEAAGLPNFFGAESGTMGRILQGVTPQNLVGMNSSSSSAGTGQINRAETVNLTVAAVITQVLPNGNLVIEGHQEMRVNFEERDLEIAGVVRPEDISSSNTIDQNQIAEERISYGGKGQITDVQQPRYGRQLYDILFPF